jgi:hypothetical protein
MNPYLKLFLKATILIAFIALILSSCSTSKKCERISNKAIALKCFKSNSDTSYKEKILKGDSLNLDLPIIHDTIYIDSILKEIKDTCISKKTIKEILKKIPCNVEPYYKNDSLYTLSIKVVDNKIKVDLIIKPRKYKEATINNNKIVVKKEIPMWTKWVWFAFIMILVGIYISYNK